MDLTTIFSPLSIISGFVVGVLVGLTGVGGGSLMTPILILLFGAHSTTAVGTDLLYASVTKAAGSVAHGRKHNVDWSIMWRLTVGSLPGSILTTAFMYRLGINGNTSSRLVTVTLGIALLLSAAAIIARPLIRRMIDRHAGAGRRRTSALTILSGFVLGVLVTISSVGAGALGMTLLVLLYPGVRLVRLVGTDVAHAVPLTLVAGLGHLLLGAVNWQLLVSLLLGSVPGIVLGSNLSARLPERVLRPILAIILVTVGIRMLLR
ncbi:MAG TPA: sulfite exporter TauE/SafE family protein [Stellaceae bacterium]|jgi:hypothetical protein|nr:sulfite exporter TauE/SafE family protein [Stellaceae bacterium]